VAVLQDPAGKSRQSSLPPGGCKIPPTIFAAVWKSWGTKALMLPNFGEKIAS
jgi:hypothetical protein